MVSSDEGMACDSNRYLERTVADAMDDGAADAADAGATRLVAAISTELELAEPLIAATRRLRRRELNG